MPQSLTWLSGAGCVIRWPRAASRRLDIDVSGRQLSWAAVERLTTVDDTQRVVVPLIVVVLVDLVHALRPCNAHRHAQCSNYNPHCLLEVGSVRVLPKSI